MYKKEIYNCLGINGGESAEILKKMLANKDLLYSHCTNSKIVRLDCADNIVFDKVPKDVFKLVHDAITEKESLIEFFRNSSFIIDGRKIPLAISLAAENFVFSFFENSISSFWIIQTCSTTLGIWLPFEGKLIWTVGADSKPYERILGTLAEELYDALFNNLENLILSKKEIKFFLSYPRPHHFFVDLLKNYFSIKRQYSTVENKPVFLKEGSFFLLDSSIHNKDKDIFSDRKELNRKSLTSEFGFFSPSYIFSDDRLDEKYNDWIVEEAFKGSNVPKNKTSNKPYVLWLGVCVEKRSWNELECGIKDIIDHYKKEKSSLHVILDGITRWEGEDRTRYVKRFGLVDYEFAEKIKKIYSDVEITNAVGLSAKEKIILATKADFFITNFLTDSMYVARFAKKLGVGYGAKTADYSVQRHPRTFMLPGKYITELGDAKDWTRQGFSINPKDLIRFSNQVEAEQNNVVLGEEALSGDGFRIESIDQGGGYCILTTAEDAHAYVSLNEPYSPPSRCTKLAHEVEEGEEYKFRFEAISTAGALLYIVGYKKGQKHSVDRVRAGDSKSIVFEDEVDKFRLLLRLPASERLKFYNVFWVTNNNSSSAWFNVS